MSKISQFAPLQQVTGDEETVVVWNGDNYRIAISALLELYGPDFKGILTKPEDLPPIADSKRGWIYQIDGHLWMVGEDKDNPGTLKWNDMGDFKGADGKDGTDGAPGVDGMLPDFTAEAPTNVTQAEFNAAFNALISGAKPTGPVAARYMVPVDPADETNRSMAGTTVYPTAQGRYIWGFGPNLLGDGAPATATIYLPDGGSPNFLSWTHFGKGEKGETGEKGADGKPGTDGKDGKNGTNAVGMSVVGLLDEGQEDQLPDPADYENGDTYIVGKHFWMKIGVEWVDIGDFTGPAGNSAYQIAVLNGFVGTEQDWLKSLKGEDGIGLRIIGSLEDPLLLPEEGENNGDTYIIQEKMYVWDGSKWSTVGQVGPQGKAGESTYQIAVRLGFVGTEADFIAAQKGKQGDQGIQGIQGIPGKDGKDGKDGSNASSVNFRGGKPTAADLPSTGNAASDAWFVEDVQHLFIWTGLAWYDTGVFSAKGEQGEQGNPGTDGADGKDGEKGEQGPDGKSAYQVAVANGFVGTEVQWLVSLIGKGLIAKGTVATFEDLANVQAPQQGWAYNVLSGAKVGHQYVYDGTQFVDMGDIRGAQGVQGIRGLQGEPGPSLVPKGTVADSSDLLDIQNPVAGWMYNVTGGDDAGHQFVYNGTDWIDQGNLRGIQGPDGKEGPEGKPAGAVNFKGVVTNQNQLPTDGNLVSDAYFVTVNLWVWNGTAWVDCGSFQGLKGEKGDPGNDGKDGERGLQGVPGKSAYEVAKDAGQATGTEAQWLASLVGAPVQAKGEVADLTALNAVANPKQGWLYNVTATGHMYIYNTAWVDMGLVRGIQGIQGDPGEQGIPGADGKDGKDGKSISAHGRVETEDDLPENPEFGWAYFVGTVLRIYDGVEWANFGDFVGPEGPQGIQGEMGAGIKILGTKASQGDLPSTGTIGDGYMIGSNFWVWDGTAYVDVGLIRGPKGDQGIRGIQGLKGEKGDPGNPGEKGEQGTIIIILDRDPGPLDGRINDYFMSTVDQKLYRKTSDTAWAYLGTFGGGNVYDSPHDGKKYIRVDGNWVALWIPDAPSLTDGKRYFLKNGAWDVFNAYDVATMPVTDGVCDCTKAQWFLIDGTKAASITFPNLPAAASARATTLVISFGGKGGVLSWPAALKWSGGAVPTFGDTLTVLVFTWDGTRLTGSLSQSY